MTDGPGPPWRKFLDPNMMQIVKIHNETFKLHCIQLDGKHHQSGNA